MEEEKQNQEYLGNDYGPEASDTIGLSLRRTLLLSVHYSTKFETV